MTIKQEYEYMKSELRDWNNRSNWDDTKYCTTLKDGQRNRKQCS